MEINIAPVALTGKKFITGATGYVGRNLVQALIKKGYTVYVLTRKESSFFSNNPTVNIIIGDITTPITLPQGIDTIYHCAGVIYQTEEMEKVNILGTKNIVDLALKNNCTLVHLSSAGVIGETKEMILDEQTVCHPNNAYEKSKYRAEQIVVEGIKHGLRAQILRPTTIFGRDKKQETDSFFQLIKAMRNGSYRNIGKGISNIIHIDEVIKAMILLDKAMDIPSGGIYVLNNTISYKDIDILVKNITPIISKKTQTIPYFIAYLVTIILSTICFMTNRKNPLTFSRLKALTNKRIYSQQTILEKISFKNKLPIEEYITITGAEYVALDLLP